MYLKVSESFTNQCKNYVYFPNTTEEWRLIQYKMSSIDVLIALSKYKILMGQMVKCLETAMHTFI